ncbi:putative expressed protein [Lyophyllum shimeji]|uniref:Expressed protein n=1 Tax=Lyophyllum shimeji TaxID=47721 RepID=A0A9P3PF45_LYOSH|nr:putative expressed protein [Lyophyllum shimeji]
MATATAVCTETAIESWSYNSLHQSPCLIGAYLGVSATQGNSPLVPWILINSVFYDLISACAACQGREYIRWSEYNANCSKVYTGVFPRSIPSGTRVPHWAYLNPTADDTFNITAAQDVSVLAAPESTAPHNPLAAPLRPLGRQAGPIAGGVVGGVVFLALIGALVFAFYTRRRRLRRTAPSSEVNAFIPAPAPIEPAPMSYTNTGSPYPSVPSPKLYDPSDPSTYPSAATPPGPYNSSSQVLYPNSTGSTYPTNVYPAPATAPAQSGRYTVQAFAQSSNVTRCVPQYDWSINSRNQTPCLVAAYLENVCKPTRVVQVNTIPVGNHYLGPALAQADICTCNVVVYSLISACGGCQGRTFTNWANWTLNCVVSDKETFPMTIPTAVEVPNWAYLNISLTKDNFDPVAAQAAAVSSSPSANQPGTSTAGGHQATFTASHPSTSSSPSHAGAIAGGVVGGIAFIAAVLLCAFWFFLRRHGGGKTRKRAHEKIDLNEGGAAFAAPSTLADATTHPITTRSMSSLPTGQTPSRDNLDPRDFQGAFSPAPSTTMYTTFAGRNSVDSVPYTGSQVTRAAYPYAAEI